MKHYGIPVFLLVVAGSIGAQTAQDQAYLAILAETKLMKMVGMPDMPDMPELPPGMTLPGGMAMPGKPSRSLIVRLWSPSLAPKDAWATLAPPAGLGVGPKLDLELYRPQPSQTDGGKVKDFDPDSNPSFTIKFYWGSSETVREGQPKIITWGGLTPEQKEEMKNRAREAQQAGDSYFYKPNWTTGYWPTKKQPGRIKDDASLVGNYTLKSSYTGEVSLDAPPEVNFLPPIQMSSPKLDKEIPFDKSIHFEWGPMGTALGQNASIMGMEGKNTLILWSSSEVFQEGLMGDMGFLQMAEVRKFVEDRVFMGPDTTQVDVPAGIFKNADMVMMSMAAYGHGAALDKAQPLPRIQTKSSLSLMLGGKQMKGMFDG